MRPRKKSIRSPSALRQDMERIHVCECGNRCYGRHCRVCKAKGKHNTVSRLMGRRSRKNPASFRIDAGEVGLRQDD